MTHPRIYLDNQGSTPVDPRVTTAMMPYFFDHPGNPHSSRHAFGRAAYAGIERALGQLAEAIGADADEIVFTSGATESNNMAVLGLAARAPANRRRILVSAVEHKSVLSAAEVAARRFGCRLEVLPVDREGMVRLDVLQARLADDVLLVSVMAVNNEVGTIEPVGEVSALCRRVGAFVHSDGAHALGAGPVDVDQLGVDLLSLSAHKLYGPKGIGVLYVRRGVRDSLEPLLYGGAQQNGLRAGTVPVLLCAGFGEAAALMGGTEGASERARIARLRDLLVDGLFQLLSGTRLVGPQGTGRHPGNANVLFPGVDAADLLERLQPRVAASTGSACATKSPEPSHVLAAMGMDDREVRSCIRFSVGRFTTKDEILEALAATGDALAAQAAGAKLST